MCEGVEKCVKDAGTCKDVKKCVIKCVKAVEKGVELQECKLGRSKVCMKRRI